MPLPLGPASASYLVSSRKVETKLLCRFAAQSTLGIDRSLSVVVRRIRFSGVVQEEAGVQGRRNSTKASRASMEAEECRQIVPGARISKPERSFTEVKSALDEAQNATKIVRT